MDEMKIRKQFPITEVVLEPTEYNSDRKLIYLDHAASTHAPRPVLDAYLDFMEHTYANVHRGNYTISKKSTEIFENVENIVGNFVGIRNLQNSGMQVIMTSNTTSSLDLASHMFTDIEGDVLTTVMEHHSNILPHKSHHNVHFAEVLENGTLDMDDFEQKLQQNNIKLVAVSGGSNVTGYMPDIHKIARLAHDNGAKILVDGAQRMAHHPIEVKPIDHPEHIDFLAGAGHKTYSPFGSSFLVGNTEDFDNAVPYIPAGGTITYVSIDETIYLKGPERHTFGTPNIAGAFALGESLKFLDNIGLTNVRKHELEMIEYFLKRFNEIEGVTLYGDIPIDQKLGVMTFNIDGVFHNKTSKLLDQIGGIATRNGCYCAQPYIRRLMKISNEQEAKILSQIKSGSLNYQDLIGTVRASIGIYNTKEELDTFFDTIEIIKKNHSGSEKSVVPSLH